MQSTDVQRPALWVRSQPEPNLSWAVQAAEETMQGQCFPCRGLVPAGQGAPPRTQGLALGFPQHPGILQIWKQQPDFDIKQLWIDFEVKCKTKISGMCEVRGDLEAAEHSVSPWGWVLRGAEMWGAVTVGSEEGQFVRLGVIRSQVSHFCALCYWTSLATSWILGSQ